MLGNPSKVMANKVVRSLVILAGAALAAGLTGPAWAQENKPPEQPNAEANKSEAAHIADVARVVSGPAASPECIHLGENAVILMAKNDLDTAQRHINLYDRFGCPGQHLRLSFRCLLTIGMPEQRKDGGVTVETLVRGCWMNPNMVANPQTAPAATPATPPTAAAPAQHPAAPAATAGTGAH